MVKENPNIHRPPADRQPNYLHVKTLVCVSVCIYIYIYVYMYICTYVWMCTNVYMCMYVCMCLHAAHAQSVSRTPDAEAARGCSEPAAQGNFVGTLRECLHKRQEHQAAISYRAAIQTNVRTVTRACAGACRDARSSEQSAPPLGDSKNTGRGCCVDIPRFEESLNT